MPQITEKNSIQQLAPPFNGPPESVQVVQSYRRQFQENPLNRPTEKTQELAPPIVSLSQLKGTSLTPKSQRSKFTDKVANFVQKNRWLVMIGIAIIVAVCAPVLLPVIGLPFGF